jgi:hypothetical protein
MLKAYDNVGLVLYYDVKGSWTFWVNYWVDARPTIWGCTPLEGFILHIMTLIMVHNVFSRCNSLTSLEQEIFLYIKKKQAKFS